MDRFNSEIFYTVIESIYNKMVEQGYPLDYLNVEFNKQDIMIFHTHTCESYTPTEANDYESSGNYRTTDLNYSVARVGTELTNRLTEKRI